MGLFLWLILLVVVVVFDLLACVGFGFCGWLCLLFVCFRLRFGFDLWLWCVGYWLSWFGCFGFVTLLFVFVVTAA